MGVCKLGEGGEGERGGLSRARALKCGGTIAGDSESWVGGKGKRERRSSAVIPPS